MDKIKNHKFIVLCENHYNPLGVIRSLGEAGIRPIVIMITNKKKFAAKSKYPSVVHIVKDLQEGYRLLLDKYGYEQEKPFLYSCSDNVCSLLDKNYNSLIDKFYFFHGNKENAISKYLNKYEISKLAERVGCKTLKYEVLKRGNMPNGLKYPVLTKAIDSISSGWKSEMHICQNEQELKDAYSVIKGDVVLVQEFIKKKNELCLDGFCINNGEDVYIPYYTNYLRFSDLSYGGYMRLKPFKDEHLLNKIRQILKEVGYNGIFEVEFLMDENDNLYFLEVNFRNSTWSYAYTYGGYNMPFLWAKGSLEGKLDISNIIPKDEFIAMAEEDDLEMVVKTGKIKLKDWLKQFKRVDCPYIYNKNDKVPFYDWLFRYVVNWFLKR